MTFLAATLAAGIVLAGCAGRGGEPGGSDSTGSPTSSNPYSPTVTLPPDPSLPPLPNITRPSFQVLDCDRFIVALELDQEKLRDLVPEAFKIAGLSPSTGAVNVEIHTCDRTLNDTTTFGPAYLFYAYVFVDPVNESWSADRYLDRYLLDVASNSAGLVASLVDVNLAAVKATFTRTDVPAPDGSFVTHWSVDASNWDAIIDFPWGNVGDEENVTYLFHYWYGIGPFHRMTSQLQILSYGILNGGEFLLTGTSALSPAMTGPTTPYLGAHEVNANQIIFYDGVWQE